MSLEPTNERWMDVGNSVLLRNRSRTYISVQGFLDSLTEYDMIEINLLCPEDFLVAVDTGIEPRIIRQSGQDNVILLGQITTLQRFKKTIQLRCNCFDEINQEYYTMTLVIRRKAPHKASVKLCDCPQPIQNFGAPAPDMKAAFAAFFAEMHPKTPPK